MPRSSNEEASIIGETAQSVGSKRDALKFKALIGGRNLAVREMLGLVLSAASTVLVLRLLGTGEYGLVGFGLAVSSYVAGLATLGLNVYLVREQSVGSEQSAQVLTLVAFSGLTVFSVLALAAPFANTWLGRPGADMVVRLVALNVVLKALGQVPVALLERELDFEKIARIDLYSLFVYYVVLVPVVLAGWGAAGVWLANVAQTFVATIAYFVARPVRPALSLDRGFCTMALAFGARFQGASWLFSLRDLAGPVVLPWLAGASALGIYTAAVQIVQRLGFLRVTVWRVAVPGLSRLQSDPEGMRRAVERAAVYVAVLLGGALSLLSVTSGWLVPLLFGREWNGVSLVLPYVALASIMAGIFALHSAALTSAGALRDLTIYHLAMVVLVWSAAVVLVPRLGAVGVGLAEIVGCASYMVLGLFMHRRYGRIDYRNSLGIVLVAAVPVLASPYLSNGVALLAWLASAAAVVLFSAAARSALRDMLSVMRTRRLFA